jgi:hypothetical protein
MNGHPVLSHMRVTPLTYESSSVTLNSDGSTASADKLQDQDNEGDEKQNVNVRAQHVKSDEAQKPQHQQYYEDCPEHLLSISFLQCVYAPVWYGALDSAAVAVFLQNKK